MLYFIFVLFEVDSIWFFFFYIRVDAAGLLLLGCVGRVDHGFVVDEAVFEVTSSNQLLQPMIDGLKRVHTCGRGQRKAF